MLKYLLPHTDTATFVDELFAVINAKSYVPGYVPPQTKPLASPSFQAPPATSATFPAPNATTFNGPPQQARKRSYNESNDGGNSGGYGGGDRQIKQMRRSSGRGGRDDAYSGRGGRGGYHPPPVAHNGSPPMLSGFPSNMPLPPPPPGASFDDPMAAIMAMQAMGLPPLPGMPALPPSGSPPPVPPYGQGLPGTQAKNKINARCRDYDTKGICTRGVNCPFIHENSIVMPDQEYDPKNAVMTDVQMSPTTPKGLNFPLSDPHTNGHNHTHGPHRGRGRGDRGGYNPGRRTNRAEFSSAGPNSDRSITTIVVEQIPEENFSESSVRSFFSQFGTIESVDMQAYKRLALVKFSDYASANRAHQSPKVIFDNRFVKVFWYKPPPASSDPNPSPTNGKTPPAPTSAEPDFDKEKFARDAEAAQKKHEEKQALLKDAESKRQALEKQQEELARRQAEEKRKLQEKLAAKGQASPPSEQQTNGTTNGDKDENVSAQTKALRAQVAALEAEARSLGLDHALTEDPWSPQRGRGRGRGRGSYRGWEGFAGRGSYAPRGRGSYRGRGGVSAAGYNLDLRPKKVAVGGVEWTGERDEALRQYLLVSLSPHNSLAPLLAFKAQNQGTDKEPRASANTTPSIPPLHPPSSSYPSKPALKPKPSISARVTSPVSEKSRCPGFLPIHSLPPLLTMED